MQCMLGTGQTSTSGERNYTISVNKLLTNKLTDVYANLVLVINYRILNVNTTQKLAFNVRAQF